MNSFASISLVLLFLIKGMAPGIDLGCELQKLPNLLNHYEEHKACNDGSFWQFILDDYINFDGDSQDHHNDDEHKNLPFHGNHHCCNFSIFFTSDEHFTVMVLDFTTQTKFSFHDSFQPSEFLDSPFQPPQV